MKVFYPILDNTDVSYNYFKETSNEYIKERLADVNHFTLFLPLLEDRERYYADYFAMIKILEERGELNDATNTIE